VRNIDDIRKDFLTQVASVNSNYDVSQGSFMDTLARAIASTQYVTEELTQSLLNRNHLFTAKGSDLDNLVSLYGITRQVASTSHGPVTIINNSSDPITISNGQEFFNLKTGYSYLTLNTSDLVVTSLVGTTLNVKGSSVGKSFNLVAGSQLFDPDNPNLIIKVGHPWELGVTEQEGYVGDIEGGEDEESDISLSLRTYRRLASYSTGSQQHITELLSAYPGVERSYVRAGISGFVEIWVDGGHAYTEEEKGNLLSYIFPYLPAGSIPIVIQAARKQIDLHLDVIPFKKSNLDLDVLSQQASSVLVTLVEGLEVGESLSEQTIVQATQPLFQNVKLAWYSTLSAYSNEILVLGNVKINYPV
jgi:hypothetical protein